MFGAASGQLPARSFLKNSVLWRLRRRREPTEQLKPSHISWSEALCRQPPSFKQLLASNASYANLACFLQVRGLILTITMTTLILAHGRRDTMRCHPACTPSFDLSIAICVDICAELEPDVVVDLRSASWPLPARTFVTVIDAGGMGGESTWLRLPSFWRELHRVMQPEGRFFGRTYRRPLVLRDEMEKLFRVEKREAKQFILIRC